LESSGSRNKNKERLEKEFFSPKQKGIFIRVFFLAYN
jgi:hypothetical protein